MGKQSVKGKPKVLFSNIKTSNTTINTYSKTLSSLSQSCTKSLIMQLKKKIPDNNYYENNGVLKRDLSIETDICILRRYYKANKTKINNKQTSSARSKYSMNNTEVDTMTELKGDSSACGDSEPKIENAFYNVDLTSLVVDNLKSLLNDWIKKYLLENDETKHKIETVLDSILHKVELEKTSSSCTYSLGITVKKDIASDNETRSSLECERHKISSLTIPLTGTKFKLISTLSVPKKTLKSPKKIRVNKFQRNHLNTKLSKLNLNCSQLNVLGITTESFTKRFATYQKHKNDKVSESKMLHNRPRSSHSTISSFQYLKTNEIDIDEEYLKRSLKHENKAVVEKTSIIDKTDDPTTYTKKYSMKKENMMNEDQMSNKCTDELKFITHANRKYSRNKHRITKRYLPTYAKIREKKFSFVCTKSTNCMPRQKEFMNHIKSVIRYFEKCNYVSNIKFNIQISVFPNPEVENGTSALLSQRDDTCKYEEDKTFIYNLKPKTSTKNSIVTSDSYKQIIHSSKDHLKLINLLDGAASQSKYLAATQTPSVKSCHSMKCNNDIKDKNTDTSGLEIARDLGEIKTIIRDLSSLAQNIIKEHLGEKCKSKVSTPKPEAEQTNVESLEQKSASIESKQSRGVQCSYLETKNVFTSGLKLRKGPRQRDVVIDDLHARLTKRSTSYRIIESESVLKIHDMTSAAQLEEKSVDQVTDKAMTCSLQKSKSLFEMTGANNKKLLAFYCDDYLKPNDCIYETNLNIPYTEICSYCSHPRHLSTIKYCSRQCSEDLNSPSIIQCDNKNCKNYPQEEVECDHATSSVFIDIENACEKKFVVRKRSVSFREGCFYCTLLWIPVLVISWFFYVFTLKDFIASKQKTLRLTAAVTSSSSPFPISLTDLGF